MFSAGIRNPRRSLLICMAVSLAAFASIGWGMVEMQAAGQETQSSGLKIGLALLPAILAPLMAFNFWWAIKVMQRIRRGENAIARWTVTAAELSEFAAIDKARDARGVEHLNDWSPPRESSSSVEVIFAPDAVLAGDTYFSLANKGLFRFTGVRMLGQTPPVIAFQTLTTYANRFGTRTTAGELRIPVASSASAEAACVVTHFQGVVAGTVNATPGFYRRRVGVGVGVVAAVVFVAVAVVGFLLGPADIADGVVSVASVMVVVGVVFGVAAIILAFAAGMLGRRRRER